tara:strand:- start:1097 stop:1444 length:348 start_codon:yes stop_codon:yes gene_type:complete
MDIDALSDKIAKIQKSLRDETLSYNETVKNLYGKYEDNIDLKQEYYHILDEREKSYHLKNEEYKALISQFSYSYLEMSSFYVGSNLPREHVKTFFDSGEDMNTLYFMFVMSLFLK